MIAQAKMWFLAIAAGAAIGVAFAVPYIDPKRDPSVRRRGDAAVDLSHSGRDYVTLLFSTSPHASPELRLGRLEQATGGLTISHSLLALRRTPPPFLISPNLTRTLHHR